MKGPLKENTFCLLGLPDGPLHVQFLTDSQLKRRLSRRIRRHSIMVLLRDLVAAGVRDIEITRYSQCESQQFSWSFASSQFFFLMLSGVEHYHSP